MVTWRVLGSLNMTPLLFFSWFEFLTLILLQKIQLGFSSVFIPEAEIILRPDIFFNSEKEELA